MDLNDPSGKQIPLNLQSKQRIMSSGYPGHIVRRFGAEPDLPNCRPAALSPVSPPASDLRLAQRFAQKSPDSQRRTWFEVHP